MTVLLLTTHLNVGGIASYTANLAKYLKQEGVEVIVASSGGSLEKNLAENKIEHVYMDIKTKFEFSFKIWKNLPRLARLVKNKNVDLIHSQTRVTQVLAFLAQKYTNVPFLSTCHGFFNYRNLSRKILPSWGEKVIAISDSVKTHLIEDFGLAEEKVIRVYTGIEVDRFLEIKSFKSEKVLEYMGLEGNVDIIGAIGRLSPVKGFRYLIEAFKQIVLTHKNARLLIVGEGPEKNFLHKQIHESGLKDKVIITPGGMPLEDFLSVIDIFCLPSVNEGLGISLMEAMAAGKACVASCVGGISELISHEKDGILVPSRDIGALKDAIELILNNAELRRRLAGSARKKAQAKFSIKNSTRETIKVYNSCCHPRDLSFNGGHIENILIFELNWLGDILFSFPFIRAVRKVFPSARVTCAVVHRYKDLLVNVPWIDNVLVLSDKNGVLSLWEKLKFINAIKREKYDTCFLLKPSGTKALMARLAGIPAIRHSERVKFNTRHSERSEESQLSNSHRVDTLLTMAKDIGIDTKDNTYEYFVTEKDKQNADKIFHTQGWGKLRVVAINVGGNWPAKRWPADRFTKLIKKLLNRFNDIEIALTGAEKDIAITENIKEEINDKRCYALAGKTTLNELAAIFQRCSLMISADSGPFHLASAVGSSTIGLFGPTSYKITGPRGKGRNIVIQKEIDCENPCYIKSCKKDYFCMKSITVDEVFSAAEKELKAASS